MQKSEPVVGFEPTTDGLQKVIGLFTGVTLRDIFKFLWESRGFGGLTGTAVHLFGPSSGRFAGGRFWAHGIRNAR